ncbi:hypothetical protein EDO6_02241 [Paenibacillus xylanexedens]|nr:hypothetical protein EDO6_02241 [Paenibacillus xylanexedens]
MFFFHENYHDLLHVDEYENGFKTKLRIIYIMRSFYEP